MVDKVVPSDGPPPISRCQLAAVVIGNGLEFYDFTIYAFFAVQIGHNFFPDHSAFVSLMLSLVTFGAGFIMRPVGAIVIGRVADRRGRRPAMLLSFALMGAAILGLALTPSFAAIGHLAPILLVTWRLCQGFAIGGEAGPTMAYLVEAAPAGKRGIYGSWMYVSHGVATVAGGLVGVSISTFAGAAALENWAWRVAFLLGALVLPLGLILRRSLPETLYRPETVRGTYSAAASGARLRVIVLSLLLITSATVLSYVFSFMTTYAITTLHMPARISLGATFATGTAYIVGASLGGWLSDRVGRRALMIWPRLIFVLMAWPAFSLMVHNHNVATLLGVLFLLCCVAHLASTSSLVCITESFPRSIRGTGVGTILALPVAIFGGTTQPIVDWLIHTSGNPVSPAWYMMAFTTVGLVAAMLMRETAPARLPVA